MIDHILLGNSWKLTAFHFDPEYYKRAVIVGLREFGDQSSPGKRGYRTSQNGTELSLEFRREGRLAANCIFASWSTIGSRKDEGTHLQVGWQSFRGYAR